MCASCQGLHPHGPVARRRRKTMCRSKAEGGRRCTGWGSLHTASDAAGTPAGRSRQAIKAQLGDFLGAAARAVPNEPVAMAGAAAADVADQIAEAITASLEASDCPRATWDGHLLCGALAAVAQAMETAEDLARAAVIDGVTAVLATYGVPRLAAGLAGRAAADALMKATPVQHYEDVLRSVQGLALALCPNCTEHPEVEQYCLQPVEPAALSSAMQVGLTSSLPHS